MLGLPIHLPDALGTGPCPGPLQGGGTRDTPGIALSIDGSQS